MDNRHLQLVDKALKGIGGYPELKFQALQDMVAALVLRERSVHTDQTEERTSYVWYVMTLLTLWEEIKEKNAAGPHYQQDGYHWGVQKRIEALLIVLIPELVGPVGEEAPANALRLFGEEGWNASERAENFLRIFLPELVPTT